MVVVVARDALCTRRAATCAPTPRAPVSATPGAFEILGVWSVRSPTRSTKWPPSRSRRSTTTQRADGVRRPPTCPRSSNSRTSRMLRTQNLTSSAASPTGTISLAATTAPRTLVCLRSRMLALEARDVAGAMASRRSAAVPRARSLTSMRRTSPASRSWTTRLVLLAGAGRWLAVALAEGAAATTTGVAVSGEAEEVSAADAVVVSAAVGEVGGTGKRCAKHVSHTSVRKVLMICAERPHAGVLRRHLAGLGHAGGGRVPSPC